MASENQPATHLPTVIATLPVDAQQWQMADSHRAVAEMICEELSHKTPETVLRELADQRSIPPEVLALVRDGLTKVFQRMRTVLKSAREAPALAQPLRAEATRLLFEYFSEIRGTVQKLLSINADVMQHLSLLGTIMSTRQLSDFTDEELRDGLSSIEKIHRTEERICLELASRWIMDLCDERDEFEQSLMTHDMHSETAKEGTMVTIPYGYLVPDQMRVLIRIAETKCTLAGFTITFHDERDCEPHGGEANFKNSGRLVILFRRQ